MTIQKAMRRTKYGLRAVTIHDNGGLRKLCEHPRRQWPTCKHPWHFNYKPRDPARRNPKSKDGGYRFSLDRVLHRHVTDKTTAEREAGKLKIAIDEGTFGQAAPQLEGLTLGQLLDAYKKRYVDLERKDSAQAVGWQIALIKRTEIEQLDGRLRSLGEWRMADVSTDTIDRFKEARQRRGIPAANRDLALLRGACNWGIRTKQIKETPFKLGTETVVKLSKEHARSRRLHTGEEATLLAACGPHLRALVEAALATGSRRGELLSMQWWQIEGLTIDAKRKCTWAPKSELFLPHAKTKTKRDRRIPINTRLKAILEMRRFDPAGQPHAPEAFVFGTEIGTRLLGFGRAWHTAVLKAHGQKPAYTETANLTPESRAALDAIDLHFHDLRREAGSRWMDAGVPLATIQRWLGHSNVAQTSTYLAGTQASEHDAMARFEAQEAALQRLATKAGKGDKQRPRSATGRNRKPNKDAVGRDTAIM